MLFGDASRSARHSKTVHAKTPASAELREGRLFRRAALLATRG
jgi:hypothetical protein